MPNNNQKHRPFCPNCRSDAAIYLPKRQQWLCQDCNHVWQGEEVKQQTDVHLGYAAGAKEQTFCQNLARSDFWVEEVLADWPAPVAHEYHRLREVLAQGQIISAVLQLKDLAEILVKFPTLVMEE